MALYPGLSLTCHSCPAQNDFLLLMTQAGMLANLTEALYKYTNQKVTLAMVPYQSLHDITGVN